jgi:hypothetical protein
MRGRDGQDKFRDSCIEMYGNAQIAPLSQVSSLLSVSNHCHTDQTLQITVSVQMTDLTYRYGGQELVALRSFDALLGNVWVMKVKGADFPEICVHTVCSQAMTGAFEVDYHFCSFPVSIFSKVVIPYP